MREAARAIFRSAMTAQHQSSANALLGEHQLVNACIGVETLYEHGAIDAEADRVAVTVTGTLSAPPPGLPCWAATDPRAQQLFRLLAPSGEYRAHADVAKLFFSPNAKPGATRTMVVRYTFTRGR